MNTVIPKDTRYVPLTQQKWCCVPTCIQMVMLRRNIPLVPAELLGYHMGLVIPENAKRFFWNMRIGTKPLAGYGTQIGKTSFGPNAVFKKLKIPLKMSWSHISAFKNLNDYRNYLAKINFIKKDYLVCFDWPSLFDPENQERFGHVCVLDKVDLENNTVRIIDPEYEAPKWRIIKIEGLFNAMKYHGKEKNGGFWELTKL